MLTNAEIKHLSLLKEKPGREGQAKFLIEGKRAVEEALISNASLERILINAASEATKFSKIYSKAEEQRITVDEIPSTKFEKLSSTGTSQGILAVGRIRETKLEDIFSDLRSSRSALLVILDRISDPGNLGTILRSASWFGVNAIFTGAGSVDVYNPKVVRSAMASIAGLKVIQDVRPCDVMRKMKAIGFTIIASTQNARNSYSEFAFPQKSCLVFGSEATGIDKETLDLCDESVKIPRIGKMESLNVGVAASIVISEILRQRSSHRTFPLVG